MVVLPTPRRVSIKLSMYMVSTGTREKYNAFQYNNKTPPQTPHRQERKKKKKGQVNGTGIIHIPIYIQHVHCFSQMPTSRLLDPLLAAEFVRSFYLIPPGQAAKWIHRAP